MRSTAIADQRVYAQTTEPTDSRDGILWVDTSVSPRETFVYSSDSGSWEPVAATPTLSATVPNDVTASRSDGTTYTNTTGSPLLVKPMVTQDTDTSELRAKMYVDDIGNFYGADRVRNPSTDGIKRATLTVLVPDGVDYELDILAGDLYVWWEQEISV